MCIRDRYYALSQVYADDPGGPADDLKAQTAILADQAGWLADISLQDCYRRLGDDEKVKEVAMRGALRARRFGIAIALLGSLMVGLVILGVVLLAIFAFRRGLTPLRRRAQLPFLVPWTFIDVAEIIALVPFAMVIAGIAGGLLWHTPSDAAAWPLARPLLLTAQYSFAALVCLTVIFKRVRARSSWPSRSLGLRAPQPLRLIALGVATYGVFMALIFLAAVALRGLLGETIPLAATTEDLISRTRSIGEIITYFVLVCIIAPIVEEIIFRGYVYAGIRRLVGAPQAMLLGGLLFWAVHLNPDALLLITLIGITLSYVYERTRSLLPGMVAHGLHNAVVLAALVVHSI